MLIYLDNCSLNRPLDDQSQVKVRLETEAKLFIQDCVRNGLLDLAWSYMLDYEISENPYEEKKKAILLWKNLAKAYCPSSDEVLSLGQEIMKHSIKPKDALHISCAITLGCDSFITTDGGLTNKKIANIRITNPIDFVRTEKMYENR